MYNCTMLMSTPSTMGTFLGIFSDTVLFFSKFAIYPTVALFIIETIRNYKIKNTSMTKIQIITLAAAVVQVLFIFIRSIAPSV